MKKPSKNGFSLVELLIYLAIFLVVVVVFTGYLTGILKINTKEMSGNEVSSQLSSVMQFINKKIKDSSSVEIATSTQVSSLKLRMKDPAKDPTCIYLDSGKIKLAEGPATGISQNCTSTTIGLTTDRVNVDSLAFIKQTFYPGHDQVLIDIQMTYNSTDPQKRISRALHSAFGRASAATFDSNLLPGSDSSYNLGTSGSKWKDAFFSGKVGIGSTNPGTSLEIIPQIADPSAALRLKRLNGVAGSVDLFTAVGDATSRTGLALCQTIAANSNCLSYWTSGGALSTCGTSIASGRTLCADFGD